MPKVVTFRANPAARQILFAESGTPALLRAYNLQDDLKAAGFAASAGSIPSAAGSFMDTTYIVTDAPLPVVRKLAKARQLSPRAKSGPFTIRRRNPSPSHGAFILSTTALDLSYLHSEKSRYPYRHKFGKGVSIELLDDGSVRLFRPDGRPLWKNFKDR